MKVFPLTHTLHPLAGDAFYIAGYFTALLLWGFGILWFFFAIATILRQKHFPFNMGWWGFTFPIGVFATGTTMLGREMPSRFFDVLGTIISVCVIILWMIVAIGTIRGSLSMELFYGAPCLKDLDERRGTIGGEQRRDRDVEKAD